MHIKQLGPSEPAPKRPSPPDWLQRIDVQRSLRLHRNLAAVVALLVIGAGIAVRARHHSTYEATSIVYVSPNFPATFKASEEQEYPYDSYIEEQVHSVTGYNVLADALGKLKVGVWQFPGEPLESAIDRLQHLVTVKRDGLSYQMDISLQGEDPTHLAEIVNAITDSYVNGTKGEEFYGRDKRLESLRQERTEVQNELNSKLQEQTEISQSLGLAVIPTEGGSQIDVEVSKTRSDLAIAHEQRIRAEAQLEALQEDSKGTPSPALNAAADDIVASDPSLLALKSSLSQKRAVLMDQLAGMTPNHPLRKTTEEQLGEIEQALQQMQAKLREHAAANLEQKLRTDLIRASAVESKLLSSLEEDTNQATHAAPSFQRALILKSEITALQARYVALDERTRNLELESKSPGSVHLFAAARTPGSALPSIYRLVLPSILPLALLFSVGSVVLLDFFDRRVRTGIDIEQTLGISPIGTLFDDQQVSMQVFDEGTLRLAGGIDQAVRTANVRTVVLTSVNAGGGTTSIVEDLGSTLAKLGRKTLTIDASGATSPVAYVTLNIGETGHRAKPGLAGRKPETDARSAAVIARPFSPELAPIPNLMDQAFRDLTNDYDVVLIDAAPILISAETEYLARFADVTVLIAEAGNTTKTQLKRAAGLLERLQIPGMAVIINKVAHRWMTQAMREDLAAFEARSESGAVRWNHDSVGLTTPAPFAAEKHAVKEDSTYA